MYANIFYIKYMHLKIQTYETAHQHSHTSLYVHMYVCT